MFLTIYGVEKRSVTAANVDIFEEHRKYLSFCRQFSDGTVRYFHFNVLPFGLSPAPQVFTKLMRQLIKYWRAKTIRVVIYIIMALALQERLRML